MAEWAMQHENGSQVVVAMKDARGLRLALECGYEWVNRNTGEGWEQISRLVRSAEIREAVRLAA